MKQKTNRTVLGTAAPGKECTDQKCPFHGQIFVKNETFTGKVYKKDINHTATIEWNRTVFIPKYERYEIKRSRMRVHNPPCLDANIGDVVLAAKTRPLSKTKHHVIIKIIKAREGSVGQAESIEQ